MNTKEIPIEDRAIEDLDRLKDLSRDLHGNLDPQVVEKFGRQLKAYHPFLKVNQELFYDQVYRSYCAEIRMAHIHQERESLEKRRQWRMRYR